MAEGIGDEHVEASHLVADRRDLAGSDRVGSGELSLHRVGRVPLHAEPAVAGEGHLRFVHQQPDNMVHRVGHERVPPGHSHAEWLLGHVRGHARYRGSRIGCRLNGRQWLVRGRHQGRGSKRQGRDGEPKPEQDDGPGPTPASGPQGHFLPSTNGRLLARAS